MTEKEKHIFKDLMANKDFRNWVINPSENRNFYWEKWIDTNDIHKDVVIKARNSVLKLRFREDKLKDERLEQILSKVISDEGSESHYKIIQRGRRTNKNLWLVAATFILTILIVTFSGSLGYPPAKDSVSTKRISNPEGRKSKISLPDGTLVFLNAESTLTFPTKFSSSKRMVELKGEAYFDVAEDEKRPFVVRTAGLEAHAIGTSFNFNAFSNEEEVKVALISGNVVVKANTPSKTESIELSPGEKLVYKRSDLTWLTDTFNELDEIGWKNEVLVFVDANFQDFIDQIQRWYGVEVKVINPPMKNWNLNGHFENESLEEVLTGIQFTHGISYSIEDRIVTINCK